MVNLSFDGPPEIDLSNPQPGTEVPVVPECDDEVIVLNKPSSSTKGPAA